MEDYKQYFLGIRRTARPFSRIPIADAASRASDITNITNSFPGRPERSVTHSLRTTISLKLMEFFNLRSWNATTKDLKKSEIKRSIENLDIWLNLRRASTDWTLSKNAQIRFRFIYQKIIFKIFVLGRPCSMKYTIFRQMSKFKEKSNVYIGNPWQCKQ